MNDLFDDEPPNDGDFSDAAVRPDIEQSLLTRAWAASEMHDLTAMTDILQTLSQSQTDWGIGFEDQPPTTFYAAFANALRPISPAPRQSEVAWSASQHDLFEAMLHALNPDNGPRRLLHAGVAGAKIVQDPRFFDELALQSPKAIEPCLLKAAACGNTVAMLSMFKQCRHNDVLDFVNELLDTTSQRQWQASFEKSIDFHAISEKGGVMELLQVLNERLGEEKSLPIRLGLMVQLMTSKWIWEPHDLPTLQALASLGGKDPECEQITDAMRAYATQQQVRGFQEYRSEPSAEPCMRLAIAAVKNHCAPVLDMAGPLLKAGANRMGLMNVLLCVQGTIDADRQRETLAVLVKHGESLDACLKTRDGVDKKAPLLTLARMGSHPGSDIKLLTMLELGADTSAILKPGRARPFSPSQPAFKAHVENIVHTFEARKRARETIENLTNRPQSGLIP